MGNVSQPSQWVVQQRLRYIEQCAWWRGVVNRQYLADYFGLSLPQVSADLQLYQQENPGALSYNLRAKRYEAAAEMKCLMHEPRVEEGLVLFMPGGTVARVVETGQKNSHVGDDEQGREQVVVVGLPQRHSVAGVVRRIFMATLQARRVRMRYRSLNRGEVEWRWVRPRVWVHDGRRWHVRAWCEVNGDYRDFAVSRMEAAEWPAEEVTDWAVDEAWEEWLTLRVRAHAGLDEKRRTILEQDYVMKNGVLEIQVRAALEDYARALLHLPLRGQRRVVTQWEIIE